MPDLTENALLKKYNTHAPRYTSYPTALTFTDKFMRKHFVKAVQLSKSRSLSLYIHIPFCHSLCYYCGCNKIVTRHQHKADIYLDYLEKEIAGQGSLFRHYTVSQIHLGGGTPSFLNETQILRLMNMLSSHFTIAHDAAMSIEIDPRKMQLDYVDMLKQQGFNRLSIGVQDTDEKVQSAINRPQDTQFVADLVKRAQQLGFSSVNLDLIYGLPWQDEATFSKTLSDIMLMKPERISLFSYAHMPSRFAAQRKILDHWLPNTDLKAALLRQAIETLTQNGYVFIGMDHFALEQDELSKAYSAGQLHRNFQGYTTQGDCDLLGLGLSSISSINNTFSQNKKDLMGYYASLDEEVSPLEKGVILTNDDEIRALVIKELMCNGKVTQSRIEQQCNICFKDYFAQELNELGLLEQDGLLTLGHDTIQVTSRGRLLVRHIASVFDAYLPSETQNTRLSKVV
jgi:oxygen-independent coproporphyrinogen-3 oxidase